MNSGNFFAELKRRNVYKVAVAYAIVAWLLIQVATQVFPFFEIPNWAVRLVVLLLILGFPIALFLAWAFEITPEGIKRAEDVSPQESITKRTGAPPASLDNCAAASPQRSAASFAPKPPPSYSACTRILVAGRFRALLSWVTIPDTDCVEM